MLLAAGDTDISVFSRFRCAAAVVPPATDFNVRVERVGSRFLCCGPRLKSGSSAGSNNDMVGDKVTKSVMTVERKIIGSCHAEANGMVEQDDTSVL